MPICEKQSDQEDSNTVNLANDDLNKNAEGYELPGAKLKVAVEESSNSESLSSFHSKTSSAGQPVLFIDLSTDPESLYAEIGQSNFELIINLFDQRVDDPALKQKVADSAHLDN